MVHNHSNDNNDSSVSSYLVLFFSNTWFYSDDAIAEVLEKNKMVEVNAITDPSLVTSVASTGNYTYANEYEKEILTRDSAHPDYKIINIEGKGYTGYLAAVYDASKLHTMVTSNLNLDNM